MARLLVVWLVNTVALVAVAYLMPSVRIASPGAALVAALLPMASSSGR
jgi:putative membrane protein